MWHWLKVLSMCGILIFTWRSSPSNEAYFSINNPTVLNLYQATNARSVWVGLIDLHLIISTFLSLVPIGLSIHPSIHPSGRPAGRPSVCLMCQYNVSTLSLSSEAGTDVLLLHPPFPSVILFCPEGCMRWFFNRRHKLWFYCRGQSCCCCPPMSSFSPLQPAITSCFYLHSRIQGP